MTVKLIMIHGRDTIILYDNLLHFQFCVVNSMQFKFLIYNRNIENI